MLNIFCKIFENFLSIVSLFYRNFMRNWMTVSNKYPRAVWTVACSLIPRVEVTAILLYAQTRSQRVWHFQRVCKIAACRHLPCLKWTCARSLGNSSFLMTFASSWMLLLYSLYFYYKLVIIMSTFIKYSNKSFIQRNL